MKLYFIVLITAILITVTRGQYFCYDANDLECGPLSPEWGDLCREGLLQSPIDIKLIPKRTWEVASLQKQTITFNEAYKNGASSGFILNNGHTVLISTQPNLTSPMMMKTSLFPDSYIFAQAHVHFDSEHTMKGVRYPLEIHLVHYNSKFSSLSQAISSGQIGSALIIGILYEEHDQLFGLPMPHNSAIEMFTKNMVKVRTYTNTMIPIEGPINIYKILTPLSKLFGRTLARERWIEFYNYIGSLTTPVDRMDHACIEGMEWLVARNFGKLSTDQMAQFYLEMNEFYQPMRGDFRQPQALNGRMVSPVRLHISK